MATQTVHLFVFNTLSDWEPAFAIAGINNTAFQAQPGGGMLSRPTCCHRSERDYRRRGTSHRFCLPYLQAAWRVWRPNAGSMVWAL